jgi:hypothetical protein
MKRLIVVLMLWLIVAAPVYADPPAPSVRSRLETTLAPLIDFLDDYAALAGCSIGYCPGLLPQVNALLGAQTFSTEDTGQGPPAAGSPPGDYYPDAPDDIREIGYSFEAIADLDMSQMSLLDFVRWTGRGFALPFRWVKAIWEWLRVDVGPLALFLAWLFLAAWWVLIIYTISFVLKFLDKVINIGEKLVSVASLFKR